MKMKTSKGFTLTELLIVMAIVVVLAAVAIPTFTKQLETSRETADMEVIRNAYTEALSAAVQDGADGELDGKIGSGAAAGANWGAVEFSAGGVYTVTLANMQDAKFRQNGTFTPAVPPTAAQGNEGDPDYVPASAGSSAVTTSVWSYVNDKLMGKTVPPVCVPMTALAFSFEIDSDGEVSLAATSDNLFAPLST